MKTVSVQFPDELIACFQKEEELSKSILKWAVLESVREHKISLRKGAEFLGMSYRDFMALMSEHQIPTLDYEEGWLEKEMTLFEKLENQKFKKTGK